MRSFFISLIILSALSSESAVNFNEGFYRMLNPHKEDSLSVYFVEVYQQLSEQDQEDNGESFFHGLDVNGDIGSIYKLLNDAFVISIAFYISYSLSIILPNEDIMLQISDLSPPACIYPA